MARPMREALEAFVLENADLERLEDLLSAFNIFEALGAVRAEQRHSDFLAFLLDPKQNHGLGDVFLKRLLQRAVVHADSEAVSVSAIDLDVWDLDDTFVYREHANIDILLVNERHGFVAVIENKIETGEHSGQLSRYRAWAEREYPGFATIHLLLSPSGEHPSDTAYISVDYDLICGLLEDIAKVRVSTMSQEIGMAIVHYTQMLRRHIVSDSEAADLARRIYAKHQRALDFIFEQKPDLQTEIAGELGRLIRETPDLIEDRFTKSYLNFASRTWDQIPELGQGAGWTASGRMLLYEFRNYTDRLSLALVVGPGDEATRNTVFDYAKSSPEVFHGCSKALYKKWTQITSNTFLTKKQLTELEFDELCERINRRWAEFIDEDHPRISKAIAGIDFSS